MRKLSKLIQSTRLREIITHDIATKIKPVFWKRVVQYILFILKKPLAQGSHLFNMHKNLSLTCSGGGGVHFKGMFSGLGHYSLGTADTFPNKGKKITPHTK